ncbi:hypothetical protein ONZ45_g3369 [Pleurotus djamor]|nr:hypothetical protein ONZ45_g3369 [Pleurotus djamor]
MLSNTFIAVALAAFTTATPLLARTDAPQCSTGTINCCNSVQDVKSAKGSLIAALLSLDVAELTGAIGLGCTALVGGAQCTQQTVCCEGDKFSGLVNVGCTPINVGL